jgi:hypothetical protein
MGADCVSFRCSPLSKPNPQDGFGLVWTREDVGADCVSLAPVQAG